MYYRPDQKVPNRRWLFIDPIGPGLCIPFTHLDILNIQGNLNEKQTHLKINETAENVSRAELSLSLGKLNMKSVIFFIDDD